MIFHTSTRGFVALTSILIISSTLMVLIVILSHDIFQAQDNFKREYIREQNIYDTQSTYNDSLLKNILH